MAASSSYGVGWQSSRCSDCKVYWPATSKYERCPLCLGRTWGSERIPTLTYELAEAIRLRENAKRWEQEQVLPTATLDSWPVLETNPP